MKNIHQSKKERLNLKREDNKTMVFGALQRNGKVKTKVIPDTSLENLNAAIEGFVALDSTMVTDELNSYNKVGLKYDHRTVNHIRNTFVKKIS